MKIGSYGLFIYTKSREGVGGRWGGGKGGTPVLERSTYASPYKLIDPLFSAQETVLLGQFCNRQLFWVNFVTASTFTKLPHNCTRLHTQKIVIGSSFGSTLSQTALLPPYISSFHVLMHKSALLPPKCCHLNKLYWLSI